MDIAHWSDDRVWNSSLMYGRLALQWRTKFLGLLGEVERRKLYLSHGFSSVYEFAFKVAGVSREQVQRAIGVEEKLQSHPVLHRLLVNGDVSVNKLARVVGVVTDENAAVLADQVQLLSQHAVEQLVRDVKVAGNPEAEKTFLLRKNAVRAHVQSAMNSEEVNAVALSDEVIAEIAELKKLGLDYNKILLELLRQRKQAIQQRKEELSEQAQQKAQEQARHVRTVHVGESVRVSRYIPVAIKRLLCDEYGTKCAKATCTKPAHAIHHADRFATAPQHDPLYMAPLCREHHAIAHVNDVKFAEIVRRKRGR